MRARPQWHRRIDVTEGAHRLCAAAGRRDPFGRATVAVRRGARDGAAPRRLSAAAPEHLSVSQRRGELAAGRLALPRRASTLRYGKMLGDRKSTRLNSSHGYISYAVFCLKKK